MAENILTHKMGPLPTWGWLAVATVGIGGYYLYSNGGLGSLGSGSSSATTSASGVPNYVFQVGQGPTQAPPPDKDHGGKHPHPHPHPKPHGRGKHHSPFPKPHHHGHPHGHKKGVIKASGHYDLQKTAKGHGISEEQLENMNPQLRHLEGTGRPIPRGTRVRY
ncbi:MAG: hypothetical protein ACYCO9_16450 [Streptosporangiaceae bacterium]